MVPRQEVDVPPPSSPSGSCEGRNAKGPSQKSPARTFMKKKPIRIVFIKRVPLAFEGSPKSSTGGGTFISDKANHQEDDSPATYSPKQKSLRIKFRTRYRHCWSPQLREALEKKRKTPDDFEDEGFEDTEDGAEEAHFPSTQSSYASSYSMPSRKTRSSNTSLTSPLEPRKHHRRPKVHPSLTPWGDYWGYQWLNDSYPKDREFDGDDKDIPDFDLGEPLEETNYWERPWIAEREEKKKAREVSRKRQKEYSGLSAVGRKRAYKKRSMGKGGK